MTQALFGHGCFQHYLHHLGRVASSSCMHWHAEYTLFRYLNWDSLRDEFRTQLSHSSAAEDFSDILCRPVFEDLSANHQGRQFIVSEVEETYRIFYKMVVKILTLKEQNKKRRCDKQLKTTEGNVSVRISWAMG